MNYKFLSTISKYYIYIAIVIIVVAGVGGYWLYENSQPTYETRNRKVPAYTYQGDFGHRAEVIEPNELCRPQEMKLRFGGKADL